MNKDYFSLVDDKRKNIYSFKKYWHKSFRRTMSFKKVKNKSVLSLNISERNNERKSIVFTFVVESDGFFK